MTERSIDLSTKSSVVRTRLDLSHTATPVASNEARPIPLLAHHIPGLLTNAFNRWEKVIAASEHGVIKFTDRAMLARIRAELDLARLKAMVDRPAGEERVVNFSNERVLPNNRGQQVSVEVASLDTTHPLVRGEYYNHKVPDTVTVTDGNQTATYVSTKDGVDVTISRNLPKGGPSFFGRVLIREV